MEKSDFSGLDTQKRENLRFKGITLKSVSPVFSSRVIDGRYRCCFDDCWGGLKIFYRSIQIVLKALNG